MFTFFIYMDIISLVLQGIEVRIIFLFEKKKQFVEITSSSAVPLYMSIY